MDNIINARAPVKNGVPHRKDIGSMRKFKKKIPTSA
jgi:hypothetical protein